MPKNEGWGAHLGDSTARGAWSPIESHLHINFLELKAVLLALKSLLVPSQGNSPEGKTHSRSLECDSRQAFQTQSSDTDRVVPISGGVLSFVFEMGPTANRFVCNPVQSQTSPVCITGTGLGSLGSRCPESFMGGYGHVRLSSSLSDQPSDFQGDGSGLSQDDSHCSRVPSMPWFWDLVKLSVQIPFSLPLQRDLVTQLFNGLVHRNLSNLNLHAWLGVSAIQNKVSLMKWQEELRLLRETQPELSTSQSGPFLSNGVSHTRWTSGRPL